MKNPPSIRKRLIVSLLTLVAITFLLTISKNYIDTRSEIQDLMDAQLSQSAHVLLALSTHELYEQLAFIDQNGSRVNEEPVPIHTHEHKYEQEIDFQLWTMDGRLASRSEHMPKILMSNENDVFIDRKIEEKLWRIYSISNDDRTIQVQVAQQHLSRDQLSNSISIRLITLLALVLPVLALLIYGTDGNSLRPLDKIAAEITNRQSENLEPINVTDAPVESHAMISALNDLFSRLHKAIENITLFTANAAHELRTPLAVQKIHAQVALQSTTDEGRTEALNEIVHSVERATTLVDQLLTLSRLDPHGELSNDDHVNVCDVTESVLADLAPTTLAKDIELGLDAPESCIVRGREGLINILVRNLVENAIRHTPNGGKIDVSVHASGGNTTLTISDNGPGIPAEEREYVFERFYRSQDNEQIGTGLGLSMVKRIIEIHNAEIHLSDSSLGGLQVEVQFELAK
jgi:two-component system sensor histidine kinase QseC